MRCVEFARLLSVTVLIRGGPVRFKMVSPRLPSIAHGARGRCPARSGGDSATRRLHGEHPGLIAGIMPKGNWGYWRGWSGLSKTRWIEVQWKACDWCEGQSRLIFKATVASRHDGTSSGTLTSDACSAPPFPHRRLTNASSLFRRITPRVRFPSGRCSSAACAQLQRHALARRLAALQACVV